MINIVIFLIGIICGIIGMTYSTYKDSAPFMGIIYGIILYLLVGFPLVTLIKYLW